MTDELERGGGSAEFHALDVRSTQQANTVVADIENKHGVLDVVLANAGIAHKTPLADLSDEKWASTLDIDLNGVFRVVRAAAPAMRKHRKGCIIALSSIMGVAYGWDEHVHYSAAKAGVVGLVRGLAVELARDDIRVNGIAPGYIRTAQALSTEHSLGPAGLEAAAEIHTAWPSGRAGRRRRCCSLSRITCSTLHHWTGSGGRRWPPCRTILNCRDEFTSRIFAPEAHAFISSPGAAGRFHPDNTGRSKSAF